MTPEEFFEQCDIDGMAYCLHDGMSSKSIESIDNNELRDSALKASDAIGEIERIREELGIEFC